MKKGRNLSLFYCQEFKWLHPFNYFRRKRSDNVLNIKKKIINSAFVMWQEAIMHMRVLCMFLRGWIHIKICQTSNSTSE